jgi:6-phosphogluconolactonase
MTAFLKKLFAFTCSVIVAAQLNAQKESYYLLIGTYTSGKSEGIYVYNFNTNAGECSYVNKVKTSNPSYLATSSNGRFVYAVNEKADSTRFTTTGSVSGFSFNKQNAAMKEISTQSSGGKHPCYVSLDKTGNWLTAANYSDGSFAVLPIKKDGTLDTPYQVIQHVGKGKDEKRQAGPHAHSTIFSPDNRSLFVQDLGIDKLMLYNFNEQTGQVTPAEIGNIETTSGSGPRHIDFSSNKKIIYVIEELSNTVSVWEKKDDKWISIQSISSVPAGYTGGTGGADIHVSPDGKFLYTSNRSTSNTIGIFSIDDKTGKLKLVGHQSTLGKTPRNFSLDPSGNYLLVANQDSDNIFVFKRDLKTGLLNATGYQINVPNPVCLKWITK